MTKGRNICLLLQVTRNIDNSISELIIHFQSVTFANNWPTEPAHHSLSRKALRICAHKEETHLGAQGLATGKLSNFGTSLGVTT